MSDTTASSEKSRIIPGVPALAWVTSGDTTYCGALSAALAVTDRATDYATLMGDSGLALRTRWYRADDPAEPNGWCPSSPVGDFKPWTTLVEQSIGWRMRWEVCLSGFDTTEKPDMTRFKPDVIASIDAGLPLLCYSSRLDSSVMIGYENGGETLVLREYDEPKNESYQPLKDLNGLLAFFAEKTVRPPRRDSIINGLKQMVADFSAPAMRADRGGRKGEYRLGQSAYRTWIGDLAGASAFTPEQQAGLFRAGWWAFNVLLDARQAADRYLTTASDVFSGPAAESLRRAATILRNAQPTLASAFKNHDAFMGPWTGKTVADWTSKVREREIELLCTARDSDEEAIGEIQMALRAI